MLQLASEFFWCIPTDSTPGSLKQRCGKGVVKLQLTQGREDLGPIQTRGSRLLWAARTGTLLRLLQSLHSLLLSSNLQEKLASLVGQVLGQ